MSHTLRASHVLSLFAIAALYLMLVPVHAHAAAVSLNNATTSSNNTASTTLARTGSTVSYQLTLSGTPAATTTPVISIFGSASTTMSGSGANWTYSTTAPSSWTEGPIFFTMGWGGSVGEATTTFMGTASTTMVNVTFDKTSPTLSTVTAASNNTTTTLAKIGNVVTLSILSNEFIQTPSVTIEGATATVLATSTLAKFFTASTTITSGMTSGSVGFSVTPTDYAGNAASAVTSLTSGSGVTVYGSVPSVTVVGNNPDIQFVSVGGSYSNAGATALDAIGGSLTVTNSGSVNLQTAGTYTLYYNATDAAGNTATSTRTVQVRSSSSGHGGSSGGGGGGSSSSNHADQKKMIEDLLKQITALQGKTPGIPALPALANRYLRTIQSGSADGADVQTLQQWLNNHGYMVSASGNGSKGKETKHFGPGTKAALMKLQKAAGISPALGVFGPKTKAYIEANP